ncbi:MAG: trigger factor [Anaerolineae bacterium]|nr:trigger factor [Anaerolineae bacterium]
MAEPLIITSSPRSDHQLDLTIQLGPERTQQALQRAVRVVSKKARIPGFRPGKAPAAHVLRVFGREAVLGEIIEDLGQEVIAEALEEGKYDLYGQPHVEDVKLDPIQIRLVLPLRPTVELGDYSDIRVEVPEVTVSDADVDALLEQARQTRMTLQEVDRPAQLGDTVLVDIKGTVGEDVIVDNQDWELILRGESGWLPGFDEAFVGLAAGDHKEFTLRYPEESASRYRGQEASFSVTVKAVKAKALPEVNDDFVRSLGDYADLADYRAKKLDEIRRMSEAGAQRKLTEAAIEALIARATLAYPPAAVDDVVQEMESELKDRLYEIGYELEDYLRLQGKTLDGFRAELRPAAEKRLKGRLVLAELARREGIVVSEDEEQAQRDTMLGAIQDSEDRGSISEILDSEAGRRFLRQDILTEKVLARLRAIVTGQVPAAPVSAEAAGATAESASDESAAATDAGESTGDEVMTAAEEAPASGDETAK